MWFNIWARSGLRVCAGLLLSFIKRYFKGCAKKCRGILHSWMDELVLWRGHFYKFIYRFDASQLKSQYIFTCRLWQAYYKTHLKVQQWEEKQGEGIVLPGIMTNYKAIVIKTVWHLHRHREIDQWSRIKSPWTDHTYRDAWYMIEVGLQSTGKNKLFKKWCWKKSYGEMYSKWELIPLWGL